MSTMHFKELIVIFSLIFANYVEAQKNVLRRSEIECNEILKNSASASNPVAGGELASPGEFPYVGEKSYCACECVYTRSPAFSRHPETQVALGYEFKDAFLFNCGGSIISKDYVLTEAICIDTLYGKPMVVRTGVTDTRDTKWNNETDVGIADYILHPNYTKSEFYNDVGLLRLSKPLQFSLNVRAICLETNHDDPKGNLTVTGWKPSNYEEKTLRRVLKKTDVTAISLSECVNTFDAGRKLNSGIVPEMLCAVFPAGDRYSCLGEAGGPILEPTDKGQHRLIGVTSFGKGCETGVYTRISHYLDWIESIVWPNSRSN